MEKREILKARRMAYNYRHKHKPFHIPCQLCGAEKTDLHHEDYSVWHRVVFLCRKCHMMVHKGLLPCPPPYDIRTITNSDIAELGRRALAKEIRSMRMAILRDMEAVKMG